MHEALFDFQVEREIGGKELEGYYAFEASVFGFVDNAHPPATEVIENPVVRDCLTNEGYHGWFSWEGAHGCFIQT
ncbi:MAG: hypothetical protein WB699_12410, partial [Bacteroidota bacterium]